MNRTTGTVGVVIARFQKARLSDQERVIITSAADGAEDVLILVATPRTLTTKRDPLTYEQRRAMILEKFPRATIDILHDHRHNGDWSAAIDAAITRHYGSQCSAKIRFIASASPSLKYSGRHEVRVDDEAKPQRQLRQTIHAIPEATRQGIIDATNARHPLTYYTTDALIRHETTGEILLGFKKGDGGKWRFIGGFVDFTDITLESAIIREVLEETTLIITEAHYLGWTPVDDWRYRGSGDRIATAFFSMTMQVKAVDTKLVKTVDNNPVPKDDINELRWFKPEDVRAALVPEHIPLFDKFVKVG